MEFIFIIAIVVLILYILSEKLKTKSGEEKETSITKYPYKKNTFIFTQNEFNCYKNLKIIADKYGYEIFGKMRLADIVSVTEKGKEYMRYFGKIKSKHIDFVLLDGKTMQPKLLIELDDSTHDTEKRKERDEFLNKLCETVKLPILHIRGYELEQLENDIAEKLNI